MKHWRIEEYCWNFEHKFLRPKINGEEIFALCKDLLPTLGNRKIWNASLTNLRVVYGHPIFAVELEQRSWLLPTHLPLFHLFHVTSVSYMQTNLEQSTNVVLFQFHSEDWFAKETLVTWNKWNNGRCVGRSHERCSNSTAKIGWPYTTRKFVSEAFQIFRFPSVGSKSLHKAKISSPLILGLRNLCSKFQQYSSILQCFT